MVRSWQRKIKELLAPAFKTEPSSDRETTMRKNQKLLCSEVKVIYEVLCSERRF
jgi:hypothetical protein